MTDPTPESELFRGGMSPLNEGTVALHEWFRALMEGGFTEDQAIRLIAYSCAATNKLNEEGEEE